MRKVSTFIALYLLNLSLLFSREVALDAGPTSNHPSQKVVIVGGGIIGALESYYAHVDAVKNGVKTRITIYEKGPSFAQLANPNSKAVSGNTAYHIFGSLTPDEILSVVPRGSELVEKLAVLFSEPGGIRVDDVPKANDSIAAIEFKKAVELYGNDEYHEDRTQSLLMLGKMSMDLWQALYDQADAELKAILLESNYNPCQNPKNKGTPALHDGYRIDLLYGIPNAQDRAKEMQITYEQLGYNKCLILSPSEVAAIDSSLTDFCNEHSELNGNQSLTWKNDCSALWRPGGCISARILLPKLYAYLKKIMGTYVDESGQVHDCFLIEFNKEVTAVEFYDGPDPIISSLKFRDGSSEQDDYLYTESHYLFCPGESVGTLQKFGFDEPSYAGFAGPSLFLNIPLSSDQSDQYKKFNHCMEVHKVGIVLAWQARFKDDRLLIGVAGTKAFYGDQLPTIDQDFAKNRHCVQLNMINDVLPEMVSIACGHNTKGTQLLSSDIDTLENKGILQRWVGRRAVAYDGFPTLGALYYKGHKVSNARCTTHLGSGGVSFAPAAVQISRGFESLEDEFSKKILHYADSRRKPLSPRL